MKNRCFSSLFLAAMMMSACAGQNASKVSLAPDKLVELREWAGHGCPQILPPRKHRTQAFPKRDRGILVALGKQDWGDSVSDGGSPGLLFQNRQYNFFAEGAVGLSLSFPSKG